MVSNDQVSSILPVLLLTPSSQATLVTQATVMIGQGQKNTSAVGAHQGSSEPPGSQCVWENEISYHGESPQEGEQKPQRGLCVLAHACNPRSQVVEAEGLQIPGQPGLLGRNNKAEQNTTTQTNKNNRVLSTLKGHSSVTEKKF